MDDEMRKGWAVRFYRERVNARLTGPLLARTPANPPLSHTHTLSLSLFLALPRSLAARGGNRPLGSCSRSPGGRSSGMAQCCTAVCKNVLGLRRPWGKSQGHLPSQHHPGRHRVNHSHMAEPSQARFAQPDMGCQMEPRTIPQGTVLYPVGSPLQTIHGTAHTVAGRRKKRRRTGPNGVGFSLHPSSACSQPTAATIAAATTTTTTWGTAAQRQQQKMDGSSSKRSSNTTPHHGRPPAEHPTPPPPPPPPIHQHPLSANHHPPGSCPPTPPASTPPTATETTTEAHTSSSSSPPHARVRKDHRVLARTWYCTVPTAQCSAIHLKTCPRLSACVFYPRRCCQSIRRARQAPRPTPTQPNPAWSSKAINERRRAAALRINHASKSQTLRLMHCFVHAQEVHPVFASSLHYDNDNKKIHRTKRVSKRERHVRWS